MDRQLVIEAVLDATHGASMFRINTQVQKLSQLEKEYLNSDSTYDVMICITY